MPSLTNLIARLRGRPSERRAAPRYTTRLEKALPVHVHLLEQSEGGDQPTGRIVGYTRDVSETGLGIVVPHLRIAGRTIVNPERLLLVVAGIPTGPVTMRAAGVRHVELDEKDSVDSGYLVGVHIREMEPDDRARYLKYLASLAVGDI